MANEENAATFEGMSYFKTITRVAGLSDSLNGEDDSA